MIPIRPSDEKSWEKVDSFWYLKTIRGTEADLKRRTLYGWYKDCQNAEPTFTIDIPEEVEESKDGANLPLKYAYELWATILDQCGLNSIIEQDSLDYSDVFPDKEDEPQHTFERLLLCRYKTLYRIYQEISKADYQYIKVLKVISTQISSRYNILIKNKINREILRRYGISVCPYCNANLIATRSNGRAASNMDHFFPEGTPPYGIFALCLYELVPVCPACNQVKHTNLFCISPLDEECSYDDVVFRWKPVNDKDALDKLLGNPIEALNNEKIEVVLVDKCDAGKQFQTSKRAELLHGYGDDMKVLGITDKDAELLSFQQSNDAVRVPLYLDVAREELLFYYKNRYSERLGKEFAYLDIEGMKQHARRYTEKDYLKYPLSKLYHDCYEQLEEE